MATYSSLLTLVKEVKKKTINENPTSKNKTMDESRGNKRSRSRSPSRFSVKKNKPTSKKAPKEEEIPVYIDFDIPDRQYGDLYCKPCDSHMNSDQMWEAHIQGKRHLRTVKKGETADLKYDYIDEDPIMMKQLNEETRPIVGLQHLVEIQRLEQRPIYQCFLCSGNVPTPELLLEHIVGTKHRLAYLKEHDPERYNLIKTSNLKKGHIEPVVEECIEKHERDEGRGKMCVKREKEVTGFEKERTYNHDYSHSRGPKANNFKSQPPKAKKKNDMENLSESTNKSFRNKDWDCGRSTHSDRSYDGYPDDFARGTFKDKEFDYYKRSPDRLESHSRPGYSAQRSPDLLSPNNDYRKREEKNRFVDERYGFQRRTPEKEPYGSLRAAEHDRYHTVPQITGISSHRPRNALDDRYGDLREILEKKKTSADLYSRETNTTHSLIDKYNLASKETLASNHNLSSFLSKNDVARATSTFNVTPDIPDGYLEMIEAMSPTVFLQLAYFKANRLTITTELELKLLDKISNRFTALSMEIKANQLPTNLQNQFKETMVKSGLTISPQFSKDFEQMMEMVGQVKASSNVGSGNSTNKYSDVQIAQPAHSTPTFASPTYSTPTFVSSGMASSNPVVQQSNNRDYTPQTTNQTLWQHVDSNASSSANSTTYGSPSPYIPGFTYTENQSNETTSSYSSPFDVLSNYTKDILGGVRSKTDSHRY